jgi:cyclase
MQPERAIIAHINVLNRMSAPSGKASAFPQALWPTDTYETDDWKLYNGEGVFIYHPPNAHTDGDSYVLFRKSDVVSAGDIFTLASYPVIKASEGGSIDGLIRALNKSSRFLSPRRMKRAAPM